MLALILLCNPRAVHGGDHFLTIGGGSSVANNQVSLEKNVLYLQHFLADRGLGDVPHEILFSDGTGGARDLQFIPAAKPPRVNELLGEIFRQQRGLADQYRPHAIPHLWGPSGRQSIGRWFDTIGSKLSDDDRLFIYYTGHGTQAARTIAEGIALRRKALADEQRRLNQSHDRTCAALAALVRTRWPELTNLLNPAAEKLLAEQGDEIVRAIESAPAYPQLRRQHDRLDAIDVEDMGLERKWVKCQRFIQTAEHVALAANLSSVASPELQTRYEMLRAAEGGTFMASRN